MLKNRAKKLNKRNGERNEAVVTHLKYVMKITSDEDSERERAALSEEEEIPNG